MATRVFSKEELAQLRGFPEITRDELIRFFTLTAADRALVDPGRGRSPRDRLGLAIQLCTVPWLGFVPDDVTTAPPAAVARLARQLQVAPEDLDGYGVRGQTRTDHLRLVLRYAGWQTAGMLAGKELEEFLLARAMEHDSPSLPGHGAMPTRWLTSSCPRRGRPGGRSSAALPACPPTPAPP